MDYSKIISLAKNNNITEKDLIEYIQIANLKESRNFTNFYSLLNELKINNNDILINIFMNAISNFSQFYLCFLKYVFSDQMHNPTYLQSIIANSNIDIIDPSDFEIVLNYFNNENNIDISNLKKHYYYLILASGSLANANFKYLTDNFDDLRKKFPNEFIINFRKYLDQNKLQKINIGKFDEFYYLSFPDYLDVLYINNESYREVINVANNIINKASSIGITDCKTFSFDNECMLAIYDYYQLTSDDLVPKYLLNLTQKAVQYKMNNDGFVRITSDIIPGLKYLVSSSKKEVKFLIGFQDALNNVEILENVSNKASIYVDYLGFRSNLSLEDFLKNYQETLSSINKYQFSNLEKYIYAYSLAVAKKMTPFELTSLLKMVNIPSSSILLFEDGKLNLKTLTYIKDSIYGIDSAFSSNVSDEFLLAGGDATLGTTFYTVNKERFCNQRSYRYSYDNAFASLGLNNKELFAEGGKKYLRIISTNISNECVQNALLNTLIKSRPFSSQEEIVKSATNIMTKSGFTYTVNRKLPLYNCFVYGNALFESLINTEPKIKLTVNDSKLDYNYNSIFIDFIYETDDIKAKELFDNIQKLNITDYNIKFRIENDKVHISFICPSDWLLEEYIDYVQKRIDFISHHLGYEIFGKDIYTDWNSFLKNSK